jgi:uncharacterized protein YfaS (alpha-2-macroglobulin family)
VKQILIHFLLLAATIIFLSPEPTPAAAGTGTIEGTLLSSETNQPVAGASAELRRIYPRKPPVTFRTESNAAGVFTAHLSPGTYRYLVRRHGFGTMEGTAVLAAGKTVKLPLPLNREAQVFGRITDAKGTPLSGIKVSCGKYAEGRTDSAGGFTVSALNGGWYELSIDHPSWVPEKQTSFSLAVAERKDVGDIVVRKGGTLVVRLLAGGRPVARAEVSLSGNLAYRYGRTDQRGVFTFAKLPPGSYSLDSYDERLMESQMNVDVPEGKRRTVLLTARLRPPSLSLDSPGRVILPGASIPVSLRGLWVQRARISVYAVDEARLLDGTVDPGDPATIPADGLTRVLVRAVTLKKARTSYFRNGSLKLDPLPPGVYLVKAEGGKAFGRSSFLVTRLGLVAKASQQGTLLFAADLVNGRALSGVEIREAAVSRGASALPAVLGTTGTDGLFSCPSRAGNVRIIGRKDDSLAVFHVTARQEGAEGLKGYLYTERPAYRPGQTVYFKGVLRKRVGEGYALPETGKVRLSVTDSNDRTLMERDYPVSATGSFSGELALSGQPPLGDYSVRAETAGHSFQTSFKVLEYRKPEFEVAAEIAKKFHVGGDPVPVSVTARYYFGAPVVDGRVRYRIYSRPYSRFDGDGSGEDSDDDEYRFGGYADFLGEGEAVTDSNGTALITVETKPLEQPRAYTVEFDVADAAGREVSASTSFTVTPSLIALSVRPLSYLCVPGQQTDIVVGSATWEGKPLSARVLVTVEEQVYDRQSRSYSYRKLAEREIVTDETGRAVFGQTFPRPGYWRVTATTTDQRGLKAAGDGWVWVWREGYAWDTSYRELGVELDKKSYRPGETARVIVKSPAAEASLLVTVEGRDIYSRRVVRAAGSVEVVEVPVSGDMAPYVFVSAVMIHKGRFYSRTRTLRVDSRPDLLDLNVRTDKDVYEPGEKVRLSVTALGNDSRPREAELSLAVVDEALFAIAQETQADIYRFFRGTREHRVLTLNSFPRVYLGGAPKAGRAALAEDSLQGIKVRKVFKDTAFWLPLLTTGSDGTAQAEFVLPDNLTTWRATAVGFTDRSEFGTGRETFISRLDVMARLQPPRFLTVGDQVQIPGIITNMTGSERSVSGIFETDGLSLLGDSRFAGIVRAGGTLRADMAVKADSSGEALLRLRALAGDRGDAMELTIPVFMRGMKRVSQGNIVLRDAEGETVVSLPEHAMAAGAMLDLSLSPTLTASLNESLNELIDFPYGCVEQTMSRFLPAVQVKKLLGSSGFSLAREIAKKLDRVLDEGLRRLYDFQHEDGGWGWWKEGGTDPYLTAHVMYGLALARTAGVPVRSDSFERGIQSLSAQLDTAPLEALPSLYRAYALTGRSGAAVEQRIEAGWRQLLPSQRVQYLEGLLNSPHKERAAQILEELKAGVRREGAAAWLKDDDAYSWWYSWRWSGSAVETTALLLECQLAVDSKDPLVSSLAEFLVRKRTGRWWNTTRGTATVVTALAHYAAATGELDATYTARLFLNGRQLDRYKVEKGRLVQGDPAISIPMKELRRGDNRVRLEREGSGGALYLSALLGYYVPPEAAESTPGLVVERRLYRLVPQRNGGDWRMEYIPLQPGEKLVPGDDVEVRLTVDNKEDMNFVIIEDRLPAGFEVRETRNDQRFAAYPTYWDWYSHRERHDERMTFFLDLLPAGRHEFRYVLYPELTGEVLALPASVWPMYVPSLRSESGLWQVRVDKNGEGR